MDINGTIQISSGKRDDWTAMLDSLLVSFQNGGIRHAG
ncbi:hypothetical protein SLEP1_g15322 [Rubroshorea leprosula]|uniref:Uncharacterized protein n=1 Tax=Rubroshorea leprosula TaxID=152421 RepID=A0AAV5IXR1_9ROSI|nr:hypothetical protein SLEP1_g15322 [Rubroshorea leprosula]